MKILVHGANLTGGGGLAIGRQIILDWLRMGIELQVLASPALRNLIPQVPSIPVPQSPGKGGLAVQFFRKKASEAEKHFRPDAVFTVFGPPLWRPKAPHLCGFANGLYFPQTPVKAYRQSTNGLAFWKHRLKRKMVFRSMVRDTDLIWVETETARNLLHQNLSVGKEIRVVPNEVSLPIDVAQQATPGQWNRRQVLMIAAPYSHKNFSLLRETATLLPDFTFHTTLPQNDFQQFFPDADENPNIHNKGVMDPAQLPDLYAHGSIVFCPSVAEISSATWLEAMAFGRPLVCADILAAREICGDAALYFDKYNPQEAAVRLLELESSVELYRQLVEKGYRRLAALQPAKPRSLALLDALKTLADNRR